MNFYELWCSLSDFTLKSVPVKFQKYSKHHELLAGQVRQNCRATLETFATIVTSCNHRQYFLHRISRKLRSTATSTVITRLLPLTNNISGTENETQLAGHTDIEMRFAAATIVRFPPVFLSLQIHFDSNLSYNQRYCWVVMVSHNSNLWIEF